GNRGAARAQASTLRRDVSAVIQQALSLAGDAVGRPLQRAAAQSIQASSQSAGSGYISRPMTRRISSSTKGTQPRKMSPSGTSGATPLTAKTLRPTGGVMQPISTAFVTSRPKTMGL